VATAGDDRTVRLWDAETGRLHTVLRGHQDEVWYAAFSPDSTRVVSVSVDQTVRLWDARTGQPLHRLLGHVGEVTFASFSSDGSRLVSAGRDQKIWLWDSNTGRPLTQLLGHSDWVEWASFSPDGTRLLTGSFDRTARLWDGHTGLPLEPPAEEGLLLPLYDDDGIPRSSASATKEALEKAHRLACQLLQYRLEFTEVRALCEDVSQH
jgi:WD40 repeat protein